VPTIKTTIDIGASAETVWRVLTHFPSYPKWNPFIREARGEAQAGARLKLRVRFSGKSSRWLSSRVTKAIPAGELHWRVNVLFGLLLEREHSCLIIPNGVMGVKFIQRERITGALVPIVYPFIARKTRQAFERMNAALKKIAETRR
jgi:hypothetical protein